MRFHGSILIITLLGFLSGSTCFSALPAREANNAADQINASQMYAPKVPVAYSIILEGKKNADGTYQPGRVYNIPRLSPSDYFQNVIYVKSKSAFFVPKGSKSVPSDIIQSSVADLGITAVRAPFADSRKSDRVQSADFGVDRILEVSYSAPVDPYDVCRQLLNNPDVEYACPVFIHHTYDFTPNDPGLAQQWAVTKVEAKKAWDLSKGAKTIVIGIVDSGVDINHEDLADNIWTNPGEIPGNGIDDDGNGKVDDVHGWDMVGDITQNQAMSQQWAEDNNPAPKYNTNLHGTHVAGLTAAVGNNGKGVVGMAFQCSILPVKCGADNGSVNGIFRGYEAILFAAKCGADVINCSWGGPGSSPAEQDIINQATALGAVVVVASGNEGKNVDDGAAFPAGYENVLSVGSTGGSDRASSFSNYGSSVTIYAPGEGIYSTLPFNTYGNESGTSMACPIAAGIVGLVRSYNPGWSVKQVIAQIRSTSDNVVTTDSTLRPWFYGRINANKALQYNSKNYPSLQVPGIVVENVTLDNGSILTNYNNTGLHLTLLNYLASVGNLKVTITPMQNFLTVSQSVVNLGVLATNQTKNIDITVKLGENTPWFSGSATILVTYESPGYKDFDFIKVPISLQSSNNFREVAEFPDWYQLTWHTAESVSQSLIWAVGTSPAIGGCFYKVGPGGTNFNRVTTDPTYAVYGFDDNKAFVGTGTQSGNASIYKTEDGGANWQSMDVSSVTGFINSIHFFDQNEGIYLGDPKAALWGVAKTYNGGNSWSQVKNMPQVVTSETGFVGSYFWRGSLGWFGTSQGRVLRTTDKGETWQVSMINSGGYISHIAFKDDLNGVAVYSAQGQNGPFRMASTRDGGKTWLLNVYDFTNNGLQPVYLYSPEGANCIASLCSGGQISITKDLGKTWSPILTKQLNGAFTGTAFTTGYNTRLWNLALTISYLDFNIIPDNAKRELTVMSGDLLDFDTVEVGKTKTSEIEIKNTGEVDIHIAEYRILPESGTIDGEFAFYLPPPSTIAVGKTYRLRVKFNPKSVGDKTAKVEMTTDANPPTLNVSLKGLGTNPTGVDETAGDNPLCWQVWPNPCSDLTTVEFCTPRAGNASLEILNSLGQNLGILFKGSISDGINRLPISLGNFSNGVYYLRLKIEQETVNRKILIAR